MLESQIDELIVAINRLTAAMGAKDSGTCNVKPKANALPRGVPDEDRLPVPLDYDTLKVDFLAFMRSSGHERAAALLVEFGVTKLPALPMVRFAEFAAALASVRAGA